jgi:acid phosphatase
MTIFSLSALALLAATTTTFATARNTQPYQEKQFSQNFYDSYNVLKYTGGIGPYSDREGYGINRDPPDGCAVDQVIMIMRHGERYPDPTTGASLLSTLNKLYSFNITKWSGDLDFLRDWEFFIPNLALLNQESFSGPYSGLLNALKRGSEYRDRYGHLWDQQSIVPLWAGNYERVIETARFFGMGFFGYNYTANAAINIVSEAATMGANSITPTCPADTGLLACFYTTRTLPQFKVAAARLNAQNPGLNLNSSDVVTLMCKWCPTHTFS